MLVVVLTLKFSLLHLRESTLLVHLKLLLDTTH